jgi:hydrogenase nickel incorporation protein HypA/HybF
MHELSLARSILGIVREAVPVGDLEQVTRVKVRVGKSSGVVPASLTFAFEALVSETQLSKASLEIDEIPFRLHCRTCNKVSIDKSGTAVCVHCGSTRTEIISGTELSVAVIEMSDPSEECHERADHRT